MRVCVCVADLCVCVYLTCVCVCVCVSDLCVCVCPSGETLVNVLDCKKDMGLWHGVLTVRETGKSHRSCFGGRDDDDDDDDDDCDCVCVLVAECHEQNPHHHGSLCSHEGLSNVLGAESPHAQR